MRRKTTQKAYSALGHLISAMRNVVCDSDGGITVEYNFGSSKIQIRCDGDNGDIDATLVERTDTTISAQKLGKVSRPYSRTVK